MTTPNLTEAARKCAEELADRSRKFGRMDSKQVVETINGIILHHFTALQAETSIELRMTLAKLAGWKNFTRTGTGKDPSQFLWGDAPDGFNKEVPTADKLVVGLTALQEQCGKDKERLEAKVSQLREIVADMCEEAESVKTAAVGILTEFEIYGDSHGTQPISDIAKKLAALAKAQAKGGE